MQKGKKKDIHRLPYSSRGRSEHFQKKGTLSSEKKAVNPSVQGIKGEKKRNGPEI